MAACVHSTLIQKFCRVCGNIMKGRVTYIVEKYTETLKNTFMGTFDIENNDIYPRSFCNTCYTTLSVPSFLGTFLITNENIN